ncbi:MAG: glutaredoxin [Verrucomicrobiia bacterium]
MSKPTIVAYLKPTCGWSRGVRAILAKYDLPYEEKDIINVPENRAEMIRLSGQELSPCVVVNGHMLADVSGEEVEAWMIAQGLIERSDAPAGAPTNQACSDAEHAAQAAAAGGTIRFYPRG